MEEGVLGLTDVNEGGLDARLMVLNPALEDGTDQLYLVGLFDLELLEHAIVEEGHAALKRLGVDDQFLEGLFLLRHRLCDALEQRLLLFSLFCFA